jgi:hypothetical protein
MNSIDLVGRLTRDPEHPITIRIPLARAKPTEGFEPSTPALRGKFRASERV